MGFFIFYGGVGLFALSTLIALYFIFGSKREKALLEARLRKEY